ncbi:hypothetical protein SeLEV6574_g05392 [Synchytrium endobioticum]|nr:hypothetical protein SeLEV6574_g05392 [Synchytrium endobioticum]
MDHPPPDIFPPLEFLQFLFPTLDKTTAKSILDKHHQNVHDTVNQLLNDDADCVSIDGSEASSAGSSGGSVNTRATNRTTIETDKWNDLRQKVDCLKILCTNFSDSELESILQNNHLDVDRAANAIYESSGQPFLNSRPPPPPSSAHSTRLLREQFPDIAGKRIEIALRICRNDANQAANYLLGSDFGARPSSPSVAKSAVDTKPWGRAASACNGSCAEAGFPCLTHASAITAGKSSNANDAAPKFIAPPTSSTPRSSGKDIRADGPVYSSAPRATERRIQQQLNEMNERKRPTPVVSLSNAVSNSNLRSADYYSAKAQEYQEERLSKIRMAAEMYSRGGLTGRSAAFVYAQDSRKYDCERRLYTELSGRARFRENNSRFQDHQSTVDLHGLSKQQALSHTEEELAKWYTRCMNTTSGRKPNFTIITGSGTHSGRDGPRLFTSVRGYLRREGWKFDVQEGRGAFVVSFE